MVKRFRRENRKPVWNRFVSCAIIGLYVFALVVMPAVDVYNHGCRAVMGSEQSDSEKDCPICEFARLAVPFVVVADPFVLQMDTSAELCLIISIPSVADVTDLPPCRAPPVV
jgi:Sec-independent protein secretion pathway component TatC